MTSNLFKQQAKRAMATRGQKSCLIIDHLVEALAGDPAANLKRALILNYIDEAPGITQTEILNRMKISKSAMNREIEWLFNYGCIRRHNDDKDGRAIQLETCGYAQRALENALDYFPEKHKGLHFFLELYIKVLKQDRPTLRDARIISTIYDKGNIAKSDLVEDLYNGPVTTDNRALKKLVEDGVIKDGK
ncbi:MAG: MarR family winged helix-turn-helix transcriptional regulator [Alphaproteobacteria bacterium]